MLSDGRYGIVKGIKLEKLDKPETTYNFEVEDFHTYYVGENGICVHNAGVPCGGRDPYIKSDTFREMGEKIGNEGRQQFVDAMNKGPVGPKGQVGIKRLSGSGAKVGGRIYQYEVKVLSKQFANYRLYGNFSDDAGTIVFDLFEKALH